MKQKRLGFCFFSTFLVLAFFQSCSRLPSAPSLPTPTPVPGCPVVGTVNLAGNLNAAQPASSSGGVLNLSPSGTAILPMGWLGILGSNFWNSAKMQVISYGGSGGTALQLVSDPTQPVDSSNPQPHLTTPLLNGGLASPFPYTWTTPACSADKTVIDSGGNSRQITFQFFQVHDLGTASPTINSAPLTQAIWAWYAFDTTGGAAVGSSSLLGGTGVAEGVTGLQCSIDRGTSGTMAFGDLICFNSDGSLAMEGTLYGTAGPAGPGTYEVQPSLYLPPYNGSAVSRIVVNFGTAGVLGYGLRDGLTGDAAPFSVH